MPSLSAVYVDYADPASFRVWRWLCLMHELRTVEIRPYSLEQDERGATNPWDRTTPSWSVELLALGELARSAGPEVFARYVEAAFGAVHADRRDLSSMEGWLAMGAEAGIDLDAYTDDSERWRAEVGLWHQEAEDDLGVSRVPALVFDGTRALYVRLDREVTDAASARRLLSDLDDLSSQPVTEVRRTS